MAYEELDSIIRQVNEVGTYSRTKDQQANQKTNDFIYHFCFLLHFNKNAELIMTRTDPAL